MQTLGPRLRPRFPRDSGLGLLIRTGDHAEAFGQAEQFGSSDLREALVQRQFAPTNDLAGLWPAGACTSTDTIVSPVTTASVRRNIGNSRFMRQTESGLSTVGIQRCAQGQHVRHFLRLVIPPQTNHSSNISVFNRWVPMGACPLCSQIADISRSLADHDAPPTSPHHPPPDLQLLAFFFYFRAPPHPPARAPASPNPKD